MKKLTLGLMVTAILDSLVAAKRIYRTHMMIARRRHPVPLARVCKSMASVVVHLIKYFGPMRRALKKPPAQVGTPQLLLLSLQILIIVHNASVTLRQLALI